MHNTVESGTAPAGAWNVEFRATISLAWPLILTNLAQIALATTDVIMMGWMGPEFLAAGALGANLNFAFLIFGIGLITATSPLIAIELGRKRHSVRDVRRSVRQGFWAAVAFAVPAWAILWHAEPILLALGQDADLAAMAASYLHTFQWSILPFLLYLVLRNFVAALERPLVALWIAAAAVVLNALLVWTLMFGKFGFPALGLPGAGIGTTLANVFLFGGLAALIYADRRFRRYHLLGRFWRPDWHRFREVWRLGLPIALLLGFEVTVFNAAVFLMGIIGADSLAAHSIAIQIASVAFMVPLGLGMAATVRVGLAYGAGDPAGIARAGWTAFAMALGWAATSAAAMILFGRELVGVFLDLDTPSNWPVIELAVVFLIFAGLFQLADSGQAASSGMLRGLGDTRMPMLYAAIGYWLIGMPIALFLGFRTELAGVGIWIGLSGGLIAVAMLLTVRWIRREGLGLTRRHARGDEAALLAGEVPAVGPGTLS